MTLLCFDHADDGAGDVIFAVGVEARHLRRLTAEQRAAVLSAASRDAGNHLFGDVGRQTAGRKVVEKEERLGALRRGCR